MFIPTGFGQANLIFTGSGLPLGAQITFGFQRNVPDNSAGENAEIFGVVWDDTLRAVTSDQVTLDSVLVKHGPNETGESAEVTIGLGGTGGDDTGAPQVAYLVRKNTGAGGRKGRGRVFYPSVPESVVDPGGLITTVFTAALQDAWDDFLNGVEAADVPMYLLHAEEDELFPPFTVTSVSVDRRVVTQRRRNRR